MSKDDPVAQGGHGRTIKVYENRVEIKYNMWKTVTVPIKRIDQVDISRLTNTLVIKTEKDEHKISMGTHGKAEEVRAAIGPPRPQSRRTAPPGPRRGGSGVARPPYSPGCFSPKLSSCGGASLTTRPEALRENRRMTER